MWQILQLYEPFCEIFQSHDDRVLRLSSGEDLPDPGLRGSNTKGARFGWSIANAGDLNNDEIEGTELNVFSCEVLL